MKRMLLALMVLASVAMAGDRQINMAMAGDRQMKAFFTGIWTDVYSKTTETFQADGSWLRNVGGPDEYDSKWDIQDGQLIDIRGGELSDYSYTILFLTKHEFLALANRGEGRNYLFFKR